MFYAEVLGQFQRIITLIYSYSILFIFRYIYIDKKKWFSWNWRSIDVLGLTHLFLDLIISTI